jgi:hypothetical protein
VLQEPYDLAALERALAGARRADQAAMPQQAAS